MFTSVTTWGINNWKLKLKLSIFGSKESALSFGKTVKGLEYHREDQDVGLRIEPFQSGTNWEKDLPIFRLIDGKGRVSFMPGYKFSLWEAVGTKDKKAEISLWEFTKLLDNPTVFKLLDYGVE